MKVLKSAMTDRIGIATVESKFLEAGYMFRPVNIIDCGIDAQIEVLEEENATGKLISLQIKSGPSYLQEETSDSYVFRGDNEHLKYWLNNSLPVLIILCNTKTKECFWQAITPSNVIYTEKAWKCFVPKNQRINPGMQTDLRRLVGKLKVSKDYTIISTEDTSHATAKRYSLKLALNREHTQAEIIDLIKVATKENINCEYHRSEKIKSYWRDHSAHVVWLFIYPTMEDAQNENWLCSTEWISSELSAESRPLSIEGEEIASNLKVRWNYNYLKMSRLYTDHTTDKENYINHSVNLVNSTRAIITEVENLFTRYQNGIIGYEAWSKNMTSLAEKISTVQEKRRNLSLPPFECKDLSSRFRSIIDYADNIFIPFRDTSKNLEERYLKYNVTSQLNYCKNTIPEFEFELKKIR